MFCLWVLKCVVTSFLRYFRNQHFFSFLLFSHFLQLYVCVSVGHFFPIQCTPPDNISNTLTCNFKLFRELDGRLHRKNAFQKRKKIVLPYIFRVFFLLIIRHFLLGVDLMCTLYIESFLIVLRDKSFPQKECDNIFLCHCKPPPNAIHDDFDECFGAHGERAKQQYKK